MQAQSFAQARALMASEALAAANERARAQQLAQADFEAGLSSLADAVAVHEVLAMETPALPAADLRAEFKRLARTVHPDKNGHPKAKEAFQRATELFSS